MTLNSSQTVPTVPDNLVAQGSIPNEIIGISFEPASSQSTTNGQLTFGGVDSSKFTGSISFTYANSGFPFPTTMIHIPRSLQTCYIYQSRI